MVTALVKDAPKKRGAAGASEKEQFLLKGDPDEIQKIRERAESLGISATAYLLNLAKTDIAKGGEFVITPKTSGDARVNYGEHRPQSFSAADDREVSRAEEGKSPPGKRKAG